MVPSLIGRDREVAMLRGCFDAAAGGRAGVALVAGEPGIGKTRLLDTLAAWATESGALVLRGGASDAEGMPPYLPFLEALGRHIRVTPSEALREQTGAFAPILATVLPELALRLGDSPTTYPLPPEQARLRLYEAIADFAAGIASSRPLLLILDDLHWADPATLDLLGFVARHLRPEVARAPLLLLGAYREGEIAYRAAFERMLAELTRLRLLAIVTARPLAAGEIAALAADYLGGPVDPALVELVAAQSEGNPFFAEELLRDWSETSAIATEGGRWRMVRPAAGALPASIVATVRQRLARLDPATVECLQTAAIIGRVFEIELLAEVSGRDPEEAERALREAAAARLVRAMGDGSFAFSHDTIRESLYDELPIIRRRRLHGAIGMALEAQAEPFGPQRLAELAFHFARSGDQARGASYAERAAGAALRASAPMEAATHYRAALGLIDANDPRRGALLAGLGEAALLADDAESAAAAFGEAQGWFARAGQPVEAARAAHGLGKARWQREAIPPALAAFGEARALLAGRLLPETVTVLVDLASLLTLGLHRQIEGLDCARQALALARQLEDARLVASASRALGNLLARANEVSEGIALLEEALDLAVTADDPAEAAECCACLRMICGWSNDYRSAIAYAHREIAFAQRCQMPSLLRHVYTHLAVFALFQGRLSEADHLLATAEPLLERLGHPEASAYLEWIKGSVAWVRGDYATAERLVGGAVAAFRSLNPNAVVWYLGMLALVQARGGRPQEARRCLDELAGLAATLPERSMPRAQCLSWVAETALALGDHERLPGLYAPLSPFRERWLDRSIARLLGSIETLRGDFAAAEASLTGAEKSARRDDLNWELAAILVARSNLELARGGGGSAVRARGLLGEAQAIFHLFGNQAEVRRVQERLRDLPTQPDVRPAAALPAGLSRREAAVLRLVATGRSTREIAELLHLSESTVAHHLTSIYTKTGADNRAAATAFAVRHGLA